jgi:predicted Rossmann fold flavoprotein
MLYISQMSDQQGKRQAVVIGGGAAGYFAAIRCAEQHPETHVLLLEATHRPLLKVHLSGGERCNVTHHCFEPNELIKAYPRGSQELRGPFSRFQPRDTIAWFAGRGVELKVEPDGRMFPTTDRSATIAECLQQAAAKAGVEIRLAARVKELIRIEKGEDRFELHFKEGEPIATHSVLLATGSTPSGYKMAASLGHTIAPLAPSLFTFTIQDPRFYGLSGISVTKANLRLQIDDKHSFEQTGPLLITHWGLSGPAVLRLSAFAARELMHSNYQASLLVNWLVNHTDESIRVSLDEYRRKHPVKLIVSEGPFFLPRRLWTSLTEHAGIDATQTWSNLSREQSLRLAEELLRGKFTVNGKGEFKDEFVTCGGVANREVDFRTMESKLCPGLFFAGELLDIDGITGGFNFQAAWTTGWIAGSHLG